MVDKDLTVTVQAIKDSFLCKQTEQRGTIKTIKAIEEYMKKYIKNKHNTEVLHLKKRIMSLSLRAKRQINNLPDLNVKVHHTNTLKKVQKSCTF